MGTSGKIKRCPECNHVVSVHGKWNEQPACWEIRGEEEESCDCSYDAKELFTCSG